MVDQHELIQDLKRLAIDLGRAPTRSEYRLGGRFTCDRLEKVFGGYAAALIAAGLQSVRVGEKRERVNMAELLGKDIRSHLDAHRAPAPGPVAGHGPAKRTAIAGDMHFPFTCMATVEEFYRFVSETKPERCVQVGDLYDMLAHSKFPISRNHYGPDEEIDLAVSMAKEFWATVQRLSPGIECVQILGNHDVRPMKRILECYPPAERAMRRELESYYQFDGVTVNLDYRQEVVLDGVVYHHGYRSGLGAHRDYNLSNSVVGHTHLGGVTYRQIRGQILWELNAGYMGDPQSKALSYTPQKIVQWTQGWGFIDAWGPRFIPA